MRRQARGADRLREFVRPNDARNHRSAGEGVIFSVPTVYSAYAIRRVETVGASLLAIPDPSDREQARSYAAELNRARVRAGERCGAARESGAQM